MNQRQLLKKHPLAIRWFHWLNFPILAIMIWSGLLIYWAYDEFYIRIGTAVHFKFFPKAVYDALHLPYRLAEGMSFHFAFMWLFFFNGLLYVIYIAASGEWKYLLPDKHSFKDACLVILHDLHIKRSAPAQLKYNAAQRIAYTAIIIMGCGSIITGLAIYKPVQFNFITAICGGFEAARMEHFILTIGYVLFFLVHVIQVLFAGWNNFQAMITGVEIVKNIPETNTNDATEL